MTTFVSYKMELTSLSMTPKQYADAIERLGFSQRAAGAFLGVDERQSRRWVAGDSAVPESVAKLLRTLIKLCPVVEELRGIRDKQVKVGNVAESLALNDVIKNIKALLPLVQ